MLLLDRINYVLRNHTILKKIYWKLLYAKEIHVKNGGGEYPNDVFYVIRVRYTNCGAMAYARYVLCKCLYVEKKGYIPVVDMQNGVNAYLDDGDIGKINSWEFFFDQPMGYSLSDIAKAKHVVYSSLDADEPNDLYSDDMFEATSKYIRFCKRIQKKIDSNTRCWDGKYIVGIKLRGTDYVSSRPKFHAKQPSVEQAVQIVRETIEENNLRPDMYFLASEDQSIINSFQNQYGKCVYVNNIRRLNHNETWYESVKYIQDKRKSGEDYCIEMGMLIKCNSLIASGSQGTLICTLMNNKQYDFAKIINIGVY